MEYDTRLRNAVSGAVDGAYTHTDLSRFASLVGVSSGIEFENTKRERAQIIDSAIRQLSVQTLAHAAARLLASSDTTRSSRFALEEALWWSDASIPEIPMRVRHEVARSLDVEELFARWDDFIDLMETLWDLDDTELGQFDAILLGSGGQSLRAQLLRHVGQNCGDWSVEEIFEKVGAFTCSNRRFASFVEGLASGQMLRDEGAQRSFAARVNEHLAEVGARLEEIDSSGGYPLFRLLSPASSGNRKPKNLVFASPLKPDIRFRSAIDNDIEVVTNADRVLVYDRPVGSSGLRWCDLMSWWMDDREISSAVHAKRTLYQRLKGSIPANSPPQIALFVAYHKVFGAAIPSLPALLPEVWLHWDPKTVQQRGREALLRFRMDFLLLLPNRLRVVVEVDGMTHYASSDGRPSPTRYAENMRADRELKLSGYEVFRFGASELASVDLAEVAVREFFQGLFAMHGVSVESLES
jgi:AbiJ N-terminal domain 3